MKEREVKKPSLEGFEKAKKAFEEIYKKRPSKEIMEILSEDEMIIEDKDNISDDGVAASDKDNESQPSQQL